jgi:hypothetical protein
MKRQIETPKLIKIVTWPVLWMYWPIYLALARTQKQFDSTIKFQLDEASESNVTDQSIREQFYAAAGRQEAVIALCEPWEAYIPDRWLNTTNKQLNRGKTTVLRPKSIRIRRVPAIWRLPHWLLYSGTSGPMVPSLSDTKQSVTIWTYPEKTTSGEFIRTAVRGLPMFRGFKINFKMLSQDVIEEGSHVQSIASGDDVVATFTPWQVASGVSSLHLVSRPLPGPSRGVTALLLPDLDSEWITIGSQTIADYIARHLKIVFSELSDTHGDAFLIDEFFNRNNNFDLTRKFLHFSRASAAADPRWLTPSFLGPLLGEYIRLGCYFPYRTLDAAITAEIQKRIDRTIEELKEAALTSIQAQIAEFFGGSMSWSKLSFRDRLNVWANASPLERPGQTLHEYLTHPQESRQTFGGESFLRAVFVSPNDDVGRISLLSLIPHLPLECSRKGELQDHDERINKCKLLSGTAKVGQHEYYERPCVSCVVGGLPRSFLRPAAERLAEGLKIQIEFDAVTAAEVSFGAPCLLCYEDIENLIELFIRERRAPRGGAKPACKLVLYNGVNPTRMDEGGLILFAIWWRGNVEKHSGIGGAKSALRSWRDLASDVVWVGFWSAAKPEPLDNDFDATIEQSAVFRQAFLDFKSQKYIFGYVAVFRVSQCK